jgi:hypothetical protein
MLTRKDYLLGVAIPILLTLFGAYLSYWVALWMAPERTAAQTQNILGLILEIQQDLTKMELSESTRNALNRAEAQARALEANLTRMKAASESASLQPDFWLAIGEGGTLGNTTAFGLKHAWNNNVHVRVSLAGKQHDISPGEPIAFENSSGEDCDVSYVTHWQGESQTLYGFQIRCS